MFSSKFSLIKQRFSLNQHWFNEFKLKTSKATILQPQNLKPILIFSFSIVTQTSRKKRVRINTSETASLTEKAIITLQQ